MGCASSRESADPPDVRQTTPTTRNIPDHTAINSQTAINPPLSTTTSRRQGSRTHHDGTSASELSVPRTSTHTGRARPVELTELHNVPLKTPQPWKSSDRLWSRSQLRREREDFFYTRVTGSREIWAALQQVTELTRDGNLPDAQGILDAAGITLPTGQLEDAAYDERGQLYSIPAMIVSDPTNVTDDDDNATVVGRDDGLRKDLDLEGPSGAAVAPMGQNDEKPDKGKEVIEDAMKVKCRLSDRGGPDCIVLLGPTQNVSVLIKRLREEANVSAMSRIRLAYLGRILEEKQTLEDQGWKQGHVVQALVSGVS